MQRLGARQRLDVIGGTLERWRVGRIEGDLEDAVLQPGAGEHLGEAYATPFGAAHRTVLPLQARHRRVEQAATIARTLADRDDRHRRERSLQLRQAQHLRPLHTLAGQLKPKLRRLDLRDHRMVIADEERLVRCDRGAQISDRRLVVRRTVGEAAQRPLAWQPFEHGSARGRGAGGTAYGAAEGATQHPAHRRRPCAERDETAHQPAASGRCRAEIGVGSRAGRHGSLLRARRTGTGESTMQRPGTQCTRRSPPHRETGTITACTDSTSPTRTTRPGRCVPGC